MKRRRALAVLGGAALLHAEMLSRSGRSELMKQEVKTDKAPKAIGPYSQAIIANGFVFCSGQIPLNPATGELNAGTIEDQTRQVLGNIRALLEASGAKISDVVKCTVFLQDMNDFAKMNDVYAKFFEPPFPARAAVQVARLPKDVKVEIEAIAEIRRKG